MNKMIVALSLIAALAVGAAASAAPVRNNTRAETERLSRHENANQENCGDPNWDCCLSYYRNWGPGACGR